MVLEAAMNANANTIVTFNLADFAPATQKFQIALMQPNHFLRSYTMGTNSNYALRIPTSLKQSVEQIAQQDARPSINLSSPPWLKN
jgi:hypothetical protein